jgi:hypothetical protein
LHQGRLQIGRQPRQPLVGHRAAEHHREVVLIARRIQAKTDHPRVNPPHVHVPQIAKHARAQSHVDSSQFQRRRRPRFHASGQTREELLMVICRIEALLCGVTQYRQPVAHRAGWSTRRIDPHGGAIWSIERRQLRALGVRQCAKRRVAPIDERRDESAKITWRMLIGCREGRGRSSRVGTRRQREPQ